MRQHLEINAGVVHLAKPQFAEIIEPLDQLARPDCVGAAGRLLDLGVEVMLFERDDVRFRRHAMPPWTYRSAADGMMLQDIGEDRPCCNRGGLLSAEWRRGVLGDRRAGRGAGGGGGGGARGGFWWVAGTL